MVEGRDAGAGCGSGRPTPGRTLLGGVLMGLANLVPGVSGGTMILAVGLYDDFIRSLAALGQETPR